MTSIVGLEKGRHDAGDVLRGRDALVDLVGIVMRPIVLECIDAA